MQPLFPLRIDPNDVLKHPDQWEEIASWQAFLKYSMIPVVMVTNNGGFRHAQRMTPMGNWGFEHILDPHPRYYSQVGPNHLPSAMGPVAHWMDVSKEYLAFIKGWENPQEIGWEKPFYSHPAVTKNLYFSYDDGFTNPTMGYGHLCSSKDFPDGLTKQQVEDLLIADSQKKAAAVRKVLRVGCLNSSLTP